MAKSLCLHGSQGLPVCCIKGIGGIRIGKRPPHLRKGNRYFYHLFQLFIVNRISHSSFLSLSVPGNQFLLKKVQNNVVIPLPFKKSMSLARNQHKGGVMSVF